MKTRTIFIVLLFIKVTNLTAQNFEWVKSFGSINNDRSQSITIDASGNIYTTGYFKDLTDFDPGDGTNNLIPSSLNSGDIFIQKLDSSGNFIWAKSFGDISEDEGSSIDIDAFGNVYITGYFEGTIDFDPSQAIFNLTSNNLGNSRSAFIQKLDASGNFVWAKVFGGSIYADPSISITIDESGNIFTTGSFSDTGDFDPGSGTTNLTSTPGSWDIFVQKLDADGNFLWAKSFGGTDNEVSESIAVDLLSNTYIAGSIEGNIFIKKIDTNGNLVWEKEFGGSSESSAKSIIVDASGNVYTTGYFGGTVDFDPNSGTFFLSTSADFGSVFVQKMNTNGNFLWAKSFGGVELGVGNSICLDADGNVYTTGSFRGTGDFDPGSGIANLIAIGNGDVVFIQKMDASGNFIWAKSFGDGGSFGQSIIVDASGNVFTTGYFSGTINYESNSGTIDLNSVGQADIFVQKMVQGISSNVEIRNNTQVSVYPNPNKGLIKIYFERELNNVFITLTDLQGKELYSERLDVVSNEQINIEGSEGIYFLSIKTPNEQNVLKIIKE